MYQNHVLEKREGLDHLLDAEIKEGNFYDVLILENDDLTSFVTWLTKLSTSCKFFYSAPSLKKELSYNSTPSLGLRGLFYYELYFYF